MDFSSLIFVDGTGLLVLSPPGQLAADLGGKKIGVIAGTSNEGRWTRR